MPAFTKVMSLGSSSGAPTAPLPTPVTEVANDIDSNPKPDLMAVSQSLVPMQERLNDEAEYAMFPTTPLNTPEAFSPAPSVVLRRVQRGRGLSAIGDRLAQLSTIDRHRFPIKDEHVDSSSHSVTDNSIDEEGDSVGVDTPFFTPTGSLPITLGSPTANPRLDEYLAYRSSGVDSTMKNLGNAQVDGSGSQDGGVGEKSNWAEEVIGDLERALMRLEQLADDEGAADGAKPAREYYVERLIKALEAGDRKYPVKATDVIPKE